LTELDDIELADSCKEILRGYSPADQQLVVRAISLLADDLVRDSGKLDILVDYEDLKAYAFEVGNVWIQFVEHQGKIKIAHLQARPQRIG
jgi:hypothetical protein